MTCRDSYVVNSIIFASYGTPVGSCGNFEYSSCHSNKSMPVVGRQCKGLQSCNISASHSIFGGDPCYDTTEHLFIEVSCIQKRKWIGLTNNTSAGFYNFQTSFSIPGPNTSFDHLILPMAIASANPLNFIKLNGKTLYDCETVPNCKVSASSLTVFLLTKYFPDE